MTTWLNSPETYDEYVGFVYLITEIDTGLMYIGKTSFWYIEKKKPTKFKRKDGKYLKDKKGKRILNTRTTRIHTKKEKDWRNYNSSNLVLQEKIENNPNNYKKEILSCHKTVSALLIEEAYLQIIAWKNGDWNKYYNQVINLRLNVR